MVRLWIQSMCLGKTTQWFPEENDWQIVGFPQSILVYKRVSQLLVAIMCLEYPNFIQFYQIDLNRINHPGQDRLRTWTTHLKNGPTFG